MLNIPLGLRLTLIIGSLLYLAVILALLRRKRLNVQYSIIWLASAVVFLLFSIFPVIVAGIGNLFKIEMPANLVFTMLFIFVLLLLLSLSTIVTGFSNKIRQLAQANALLEKRVRQLESKLSGTEAGSAAEVVDKAEKTDGKQEKKP